MLQVTNLKIVLNCISRLQDILENVKQVKAYSFSNLVTFKIANYFILIMFIFSKKKINDPIDYFEYFLQDIITKCNINGLNINKHNITPK